MMLRRLGLIHRSQRGFTALELLIAFAITGIVAGAATTAILQVYSGSAHSSNHMTVVRQVQSAGYWISRDSQMAQRVNSTGASGFPLTLTWTDWETGDGYEVVYDLSADKLQRKHYTNTTLDETGIVAQYIDSDPTKTRCGFTTGGAFYLPDTGDELIIYDPFGSDSGTITVTVGQISVAKTGSATYNAGSGAWTTNAPGDTLVITANKVDTSGTWTATSAAANISSSDTDGDATITAVLVFKVTATVGTGSQAKSETRVYEVIPRPGS